VRAANPPQDRLDTIDLAAVSWVLERGVPAGRGSDTLTASDWLFYPLRNMSGTLAAIGMSRDDGSEPVKSDQLPLLMNLLDQAALAIERTRLSEEMRGMAQLKERDRLRAALLSSVSHDLRTPLTAIMASVTELRSAYSPEVVDGIEAEAQRLNRFVANLLDMARVEAGALKRRVEPVDLADAIASAVHDTRRALDGHAIEFGVAADLPLVRIDAQLFHHILINLLDNAGRYADPDTPIAIRAERLPGSLSLSVLDQGPGLPPGRERDVFETFRRIEGSDRKQAGTGLGLAIVKGFAEAMGLEVEAANRGDPAGARFTLRFPKTCWSPIWTRNEQRCHHPDHRRRAAYPAAPARHPDPCRLSGDRGRLCPPGAGGARGEPARDRAAGSGPARSRRAGTASVDPAEGQ
jgi:two-component system sensor histidine kinase KdpD